jgi:hypothetical protein
MTWDSLLLSLLTYYTCEYGTCLGDGRATTSSIGPYILAHCAKIRCPQYFLYPLQCLWPRQDSLSPLQCPRTQERQLDSPALETATTWAMKEQVGWISPQIVMYQNNNRPSWISERFSGSCSGNSAYLTIARIQPGDEAVYYCTAWDKSLSACTVFHDSGN